jgi:hypothetical protein
MPLLDNESTNIAFVQAIEEMPVLYDYNMKEYSNRTSKKRRGEQFMQNSMQQVGILHTTVSETMRLGIRPFYSHSNCFCPLETGF